MSIGLNCDRANLFQILSLVKQFQFFGSLRASNSGGVNASGVYSTKEEVLDAVVVKEAKEEDSDLDGMMIAAEADGSCFHGMFRDIQNECRAAQTELTAGLVYVV